MLCATVVPAGVQKPGSEGPRTKRGRKRVQPGCTSAAGVGRQARSAVSPPLPAKWTLLRDSGPSSREVFSPGALELGTGRGGGGVAGLGVVAVVGLRPRLQITPFPHLLLARSALNSGGNLCPLSNSAASLAQASPNYSSPALALMADKKLVVVFGATGERGRRVRGSELSPRAWEPEKRWVP